MDAWRERELLERIAKLEARILALEARPVYVPYPVLQPYYQPFVYPQPYRPYEEWWCGSQVSSGGFSVAAAAQ